MEVTTCIVYLREPCWCVISATRGPLLMTSIRIINALVIMTVMTTTSTAATPPIAERHPHPVTLHGETLPDDYFWLRDKQDPKVISYLNAENDYTQAMTSTSKPLQYALYAEILSRIKQTDLSVPYRKGDYLYYTRTEEGRQYPYYCRRKGSMDSPEELLLDVNALAVGHPFMAVSDFEVSPDGARLAYTTDSTGYRQYVLHVRDLTTGRELPDHAERVTSLAWTADNTTLFYTQEDAVTKRSYRVYRHVLGATAHDLVYEENDEHFDLGLAASRS